MGWVLKVQLAAKCIVASKIYDKRNDFDAFPF